MPRIVQEVPLRIEGVLEPVEHLVEGRGEVRDLVASLLGNAPLERCAADRARGRRYCADGSEHSACESPGEHGSSQKQCHADAC
jgi:hypothetical protein